MELLRRPVTVTTATTYQREPRGTAIKILKHFALAALLVAGLLLPTALIRPQSASACDVVGFLSNLGCPFPQPAPILPACTVLNPTVSATADGNRNSYTYDLICDQSTPTIHVTGGYSFDTGAVDESLTTDQNGISVTWTCPHDPWIAPSAPVCSRGNLVTNMSNSEFELTSFDILGRTQPISTQYLDDDSRQVLFFAQLQYAAAHPPAPAPTPLQVAAIDCPVCSTLGSTLTPASTPAPLQIVGSSTFKPPTCAACSLVGTTPTPTPGPSPQPAAYHDPSIVGGWPQLSILTQGEAVRSLQYLLQAHSATPPQFAVDGKFGQDTMQAVLAFQQAQGLVNDGTVGPQTWQALIVTVQQGSQGPAVKAVQSQLKSRGQAVTVDGNFGGQTDTAVRAYQQAQGLAIDGQVGPQTWQPLLVGS